MFIQCGQIKISFVCHHFLSNLIIFDNIYDNLVYNHDKLYVFPGLFDKNSEMS